MSADNVKFQMESNNIGMGISKVAQVVKYSDLVDGGGAAATLNLAKQIPAGSFVIGSKVTVSEGFTGDTTCTLAVGTAGDSNEYSGNSTHNILAAARNLVAAAFITADAGLIAEGSDISVLLTATSGSDWGDVAAGKLLVEVYYLSTNVELDNGAPTEIRLNQE